MLNYPSDSEEENILNSEKVESFFAVDCNNHYDSLDLNQKDFQGKNEQNSDLSTQINSNPQNHPLQFLLSRKPISIRYLTRKRKRTPGNKGSCLRNSNIKKKIIVHTFKSLVSACNCILKKEKDEVFPIYNNNQKIERLKLKELLAFDVKHNFKNKNHSHNREILERNSNSKFRSFIEITIEEYYKKVFIKETNILGIDDNDFNEKVWTLKKLKELLTKKRNQITTGTEEYIEKLERVANDIEFIFK